MMKSKNNDTIAPILNQEGMGAKLNQKKFIYLAILLITGIIARVIYFMSDQSNPLFLYPIIDEKEFVDTARQVISSNFLYPFHFWHPPFYTYFLAILFKIGFGLKGVVIFQMALGLSGGIILFLILEKINLNAAFISALIWLIYPLELFIETKFLSEGLFIFLTLLLAGNLVLIKDSIAKWIIAGLLTGALIITKSQFLIFFVFYLAYLIFKVKQTRKKILIYGLITLLFPLAVFLHNSDKTHGKLVVISSNGPVNFYLGNSKDIRQTLNIRPYTWKESFFPSLYDEAGITFIKGESEDGEYFPYMLSGFLRHKTIKDNSDLGVLFNNLFQKVIIAFHAYETPRNYDIYEYKKWNNYLNFTVSGNKVYFPLILFMFASIILIFVRWKSIFKDNTTFILLLLFIANLLPSILFFNAFRYRLAALPFIIFFALTFYLSYYKNWKLQITNLVLMIIFGTAITQGLLIQKIPLFETYSNYGNSFLNKEKYERAEKYYKLAISNAKNEEISESQTAACYSKLAYAAEKLGKSVEAIENYTKSIEGSSKPAINYYNLALSEYRNGNYQAAMDDYNRAIETNKDEDFNYALAYNGLGLAKVKLSDFKGAFEDFSKAIELDSKVVEAWANRGILKGQSGDIAGAFQDLNQALEIDPNYIKAYENRGVAYLSKGEPLKAIQDFTTVIQKAPDNGQAFYIRGMTYNEIGKKDEGCKDLKKALKLGYKPAESEILKNCK